MGEIKVFLDGDVLVSSLLSKTGASFKILNDSKITKVITRTIKEEILNVAGRLNLDLSKTYIFPDIQIVTLKLEKPRLSEMYIPYVLDQEDSHVVAGAQKAQANFLLTHNLRIYRVEKIKNDLEIIVMKPGQFLQYVRSLR